jgi:protocatechuate 3,4-dioxygenase beta subunit
MRKPARRVGVTVTRRRVLSMGLSISPMLLLSACGGQGTSVAPTSAPTARPGGPAPTQAPAQAAVSPAASAACVLTPEQTEGPYYIDKGLVRSDITEGRPGVPLQLNLTVQEASTCKPISGATVEVWHCDATGEYSGYESAQMQAQPNSGYDTPTGGPAPAGGIPKPGAPPPGPGGPGAGGHGGRQQPTNTLTFLRGGQVSDASGVVTLHTIYPGWYRGRTTHIHLKVHVSGQVVHTGQMYMDDSISSDVYSQPPYSARPNRDTTNDTDMIYRSGGPQAMLSLSPSSDGFGYVGTMTLGVKA